MFLAEAGPWYHSMDDYWDGRYRAGGKIWGDTPSITASHACRVFLSMGVKSVLVPGIGYGRNARVFLEAGMAVSGIEVSREAVRILGNDFPGVRCSEGSALDVPFGGPYDAVYCLNVLHFFRLEGRRAFLGKCLAALREGGPAFFAVLSEKDPGYGRGAEIEPGTFESKPGRPVHYFTGEDVQSHFGGFEVIGSGLVEDSEDHGEEGPHVHVLRYVLARKPGERAG